MRKIISIIAFYVFLVNISFSNGITYNQGIITELFFDSYGDWTVEFRITHLHHYTDSAFYIHSFTDSARLVSTPDSLGYYVITQADVTSNLNIDPDGDILFIRSYGESYGYVQVSDEFIYGNMPESGVNAPYVFQSIVTTHGYQVKDNEHSPGYFRDPDRGAIKGYVYDSLGNPLPYQKVQAFDVTPRIMWSDENGYFEDTTLYGRFTRVWIWKDNPIHILDTNLYIEPEVTSQVNYTLPIGPSVNVSGMCFLSDTNDHRGTFVIFTPECPNAIPDTAVTDSSGYYNIDITPANYNYRFSHPAYLPECTFIAQSFYEDKILDTDSVVPGVVNEVPTGKLSGHWVPNADYWIMGDIYIDHGDTLILDPGVNVVFKGIWKFDIYGILIAEGTPDDSIYMVDGMEGWKKWQWLNFYDSLTVSRLSYIHLEGIFDGVNFYDNSSQILNSFFNWAGHMDIEGMSSPEIGYSKFRHIGDPVINCNDESHSWIHHNTIMGGGVRLWDNSTALIEYNSFINQFIGVWCHQQSNTEIRGNIVYSSNFVSISSDDAQCTIEYNCLWESSPGWGQGPYPPGYGINSTVNIHGDSCDIYYNLIEADPLFIDPENEDFNLLSGSPCIDAGDPDSPDDPDNTIADIGAFYFDQTGMYVKENNELDVLYKMKVIPNPNRGDFSISVDSRLDHYYVASLNIHSINGVILDSRNIAHISKGENLIRYSNVGQGEVLSNGLYICTLNIAGRPVSSTKILIINE